MKFMDFLFTIAWTALFVFLARLVFTRMKSRKRLFILMALNLVFLASLFGLFPVVIAFWKIS